MTADAVAQIVFLLGWLVLAGSAFASFRLNWQDTLRMALIWAAIFVGLAWLISMIL